jgi:hypothetical protein
VFGAIAENSVTGFGSTTNCHVVRGFRFSQAVGCGGEAR